MIGGDMDGEDQLERAISLLREQVKGQLNRVVDGAIGLAREVGALRSLLLQMMNIVPRPDGVSVEEARLAIQPYLDHLDALPTGLKRLLLEHLVNPIASPADDDWLRELIDGLDPDGGAFP